MLNQRLLAQVGRCRPFLDAGLLVLCLGFIVLALFQPGSDRQPDVRLQRKVPHTSVPPLGIPVSDFDAFHRSNPADAKAVRADVAETGLDLVLYGTHMGGDGEGLAIIGSPNGEQRAVRVGEEVADGAVLESVQTVRVLLRRKGALEALTLVGAESRPVRFAEAVVLPRPSQRVNGDAIFNALSLRPLEGPRGVRGAVLSQGQDAELFRQLGLQGGDILLSVNERPLSSHEAIASLGNELHRSGRITLEIEREGDIRTISLGTQ